MTRIVKGLLANVAASLELSLEDLELLLEDGAKHPAKHARQDTFRALRRFSQEMLHSKKNEGSAIGKQWDKPALKLFHFREVLMITS